MLRVLALHDCLTTAASAGETPGDWEDGQEHSVRVSTDGSDDLGFLSLKT